MEGYSLYDRTHIEMLLEKLVTTKPASHRPRRTVAGTRIPPDTDLVLDSMAEEDLDEDLEQLWSILTAFCCIHTHFTSFRRQ